MQKTRPALIVNDDRFGVLPLKIIVPLTDWKEQYVAAPWMIKIDSDEKNSLSKTSAIDCFQIRSVSEERFIRRMGEVDDSVMFSVERALAKVLNI